MPTDILVLALVCAGTIFGCWITLWLVSLVMKDSSIGDPLYPVIMAITAGVFYAICDGNPARQKLVLVMALIWAARLAWHIGARNWGREDPRYARLRAHAASLGKNYALYSLTHVFLSLGAASGRVKFFGRRSRAEFTELIAACDVLLDPFPVGGGISTWDALAAGTPIVTLPGTAMRSRFASAALARAGLTATVAADAAHYSALAVQMAQDREARDSWRMQMVTAAGEIHRDSTAVAEWVAAVLAATNTASA